MKKIIMIISIVLMSNLAFTQGNKKVKQSDKPKIEVYYFHVTNRCPTCLSIEANTKKTLDTYFAKEQKEGTIMLKVYNVDEKINRAISENYAAFGSSLFITKIMNGKETRTDMTNFAFQNSHNRPEEFIKGLKEKITENLK